MSKARKIIRSGCIRALNSELEKVLELPDSQERADKLKNMSRRIDSITWRILDRTIGSAEIIGHTRRTAYQIICNAIESFNELTAPYIELADRIHAVEAVSQNPIGVQYGCPADQKYAKIITAAAD